MIGMFLVAGWSRKARTKVMPSRPGMMRSCKITVGCRVCASATRASRVRAVMKINVRLVGEVAADRFDHEQLVVHEQDHHRL